MGLRHHRYHSAKTSWRNRNRGSYGVGVSQDNDNNVFGAAWCMLSIFAIGVTKSFLMCIIIVLVCFGLIQLFVKIGMNKKVASVLVLGPALGFLLAMRRH